MLTIKKASFWKRLIALLIDAVMFAASAALITVFFDIDRDISHIFTTSAFYLYNIFFEYFGGGTIGKSFMEIRVISIDGNRPSLLSALFRNIGKVISGIPFGLGFFIILAPHVRQTVHDRLGRCLVVERHRQKS